MTIGNRVLFILLVVFAAGCTQSGNGDAKDQSKESTTTVWSGQVQTIDKAKGVEQTLMQSAQQQSNEIDKQSR